LGLVWPRPAFSGGFSRGEERKIPATGARLVEPIGPVWPFAAASWAGWPQGPAVARGRHRKPGRAAAQGRERPESPRTPESAALDLAIPVASLRRGQGAGSPGPPPRALSTGRADRALGGGGFALGPRRSDQGRLGGLSWAAGERGMDPGRLIPRGCCCAGPTRRRKQAPVRGRCRRPRARLGGWTGEYRREAGERFLSGRMMKSGIKGGGEDGTGDEGARGQ